MACVFVVVVGLVVLAVAKQLQETPSVVMPMPCGVGELQVWVIPLRTTECVDEDEYVELKEAAA